MQDKHPLETIIENIIASLPSRGAIKANVKLDAQAALEKWRTETPTPTSNSELTDLRALNVAVQKALKWMPPEAPVGAQVTRQYQPMPVPGEQPAGWKRADPVTPPGMVRAQPVTRPSIAGQVAMAVAANITDGLPPGVVQAQRMQSAA